MRTSAKRLRAVFATVVAITVLAASQVTVPSGTAAAAGARPSNRDSVADVDWVALVPTAESLQRVAFGLPDDPVEAVERLVDVMWSDDSLAAVSALGELLRRAGLPLVAAEGPVVALPDSHAVVDATVPVEFLPTLADAARDGTIYTAEQFGEALQFVGYTTELLAPEEVVELLAAWGKQEDDVTETVTAGAAARALARARGELLIPELTLPTPTPALDQAAIEADELPASAESVVADPGGVTGISPITLLMLVAHAAGTVAADVAVVPAASGLHSGRNASGLRPSVSGVDCSQLVDKPTSKSHEHAQNAGQAGIKETFRKGLDSALKWMGSPGAAAKVAKGAEVYDKVTDFLTVLMLVLGTELKLESDKPETHFRHSPRSEANDLKFTATAKFRSALAKKQLPCWGLIGIQVPPDGPLKNYTVKWRIKNAPDVFRAKIGEGEKLRKGGKTDASGRATLKLFPRTEMEPPKAKQPEITLKTAVYANLDPEEFPLKFSDLIDVVVSANVTVATVKALYNLLLAVMKRVGMPTKVLNIPVKYHGQMPFVMVGEMNARAKIAAISIDLRTDLYSCLGPLGPWQGTVGAGGDVAIRHSGSAPEVVGGGQGDFPMRFDLVETGQPQNFHVQDGVGLQIKLDPGAVQRVLRPQHVRDMLDGFAGGEVVGSGTWTVDGTEVARKFAQAKYMRWADGTERFQVVSKSSDERCPGTSYQNHNFDRN